jgi:hypothetical protein
VEEGWRGFVEKIYALGLCAEQHHVLLPLDMNPS